MRTVGNIGEEPLEAPHVSHGGGCMWILLVVRWKLTGAVAKEGHDRIMS